MVSVTASLRTFFKEKAGPAGVITILGAQSTYTLGLPGQQILLINLVKNIVGLFGQQAREQSTIQFGGPTGEHIKHRP